MMIKERVSVVREIAKNALMGSRIVAALRSRTATGRMPISRTDIDGNYAHAVHEWAQYTAALREAAFPDDWWSGKAVLEIGPGTNLAVELALVAEGAARGDALDRFGGVRFGNGELELYRRMIDALDGERQCRARNALVVDGDTFSFRDVIRYYPDVRLEEADAHITQLYDVVLAHESLEHVQHLERGIQSVTRLLKPDGVCVFICHVTSLGGVYNGEVEPLRLLYYSDVVWNMMFGNRGGSNRVRASQYRDILQRSGLEIVSFSVLERMADKELAAVKPQFNRRFRALTDDDLAVLKFALVARKPG